MAKSEIAETIDDAGIAPLPYAVVSLYDHWSRDMARFWSQMAMAGTPTDALKAEVNLDLTLWNDYVDSMRDLWLTPFKIYAGMVEAAAAEEN
jgi:hypothetical protein